MLVDSLVTLLLVSFVSAAHAHTHDHTARSSLPGTWYHARDHPVHALFARDTASFPAVGSAEWTASLPPFTPDGSHTPDITKLPQAWVDAYNAAVARGAIPKIDQSTSAGNYPNNQDPNGAAICSSYIGCRAPGDIFNTPAGTLGLNFDDGPTEVTQTLLDFLAKNNEIATHFLIGYSIQQNPQAFLATLNSGHDLAVHTWSHPALTTLTDMQVVSELGWSMNILYLSTNGRVPRFWRPPTGDADNRIRAIAKEVFGLEMVVWNHDTEDWSLTQGTPLTTPALIASNMTLWLNGPQDPGMLILEHELSDQSVAAFVAAYPLMKSKWKLNSAARLVDPNGAYRNTAGPTGSVTAAGLLDFKGQGSSGNGSGGGAASAGSAGGSSGSTGSASVVGQTAQSGNPASQTGTKSTTPS
ncbi:carbohydrate esterase family 4 protein [Mycena floridula]|nr:carbohydrate esterase family 4 protein [Mycena floridula]